MLKYFITTLTLILFSNNLFSQVANDELEFYSIRPSDRMLCKISTTGKLTEISKVSSDFPNLHSYLSIDYNKVDGNYYIVNNSILFKLDAETGQIDSLVKLKINGSFSNGIVYFVSINSKGEFYVFIESNAALEGKLFKLNDINTGVLTPLSNNTSGMASILGIEFDDEDNLWNVDECCRNAINRFNLGNGVVEKNVPLSIKAGFPTDLDYRNSEMYFLDIGNEFNPKSTKLLKTNPETGETELLAVFNGLYTGLATTNNKITTPKSCEYELFDYSSLESKYNLETNGDQLIYKDFIRMTDDYQYQKSFLNYKDYINVTNDFQTSFTFRIDDNARFEDTTSKEDGFAFVIYNDSTFNYNSIKSNHFFEGFSNAFVIEIDLFQNYDYFRDPNDNHLAIFANKFEISPNHEKNDLIFENIKLKKIIRDNREYTLFIKYDKDRQSLKVDLEDVNSKVNIATLNNFSFEQYIDLREDRFAKIGILSSTGKTYQIQEIADWKYCSTEYVEILKTDEGIVYPNPSSDYIYLTDFNDIVKVKIIDIYGKLQENLIYDKNLKRVDITSLKKGIYFVIIESENNTYIRKFIKS